MTLKNVKISLNKIAKSLEGLQDDREFLLKNSIEELTTGQSPSANCNPVRLLLPQSNAFHILCLICYVCKVASR